MCVCVCVCVCVCARARVCVRALVRVQVEGDTSVDRLKAILQDRVGTPAKDLIVLYKGKSLQGTIVLYRRRCVS